MAIRVAGLRRRLLIDVHSGAYGQYRQDLLDPTSSLHQFAPQTMLFSVTAREAITTVPLTATVTEVDETTNLINLPGALTLQFRLLDRIGDNGLVSAMILRPTSDDEGVLEIEKQFLPQAGLGPAQAFAIILSLMILTFGIAGIGIAAWLLGRQIGPKTPVSGSHMALLAVLIVVVLGAAVFATASAQPGDSTSITALKAEAQKAIEALNGSTVDGRNLTVNIAKPREERTGGGGGGGGGRREYGGGGGGGGRNRY